MKKKGGGNRSNERKRNCAIPALPTFVASIARGEEGEWLENARSPAYNKPLRDDVRPVFEPVDINSSG
jgi:hypothetical protein